MNQSYKFAGGSEAPAAFGPLPAGDYSFEISNADEPYSKNEKWILPLRIVIKPNGLTVYANAWTGKTRDGEFRDGIGDLLLCVNRAPGLGAEPNWRELIGARGKCRLKVEIAQMGALAGKEVNKVAFFHRPKQIGPDTEGPSQSFTEAESKESQQAIAKTLGARPKDPDLDVEPDDIPF